MKGLKSTPQSINLPKVTPLPAGSMGGTGGKGINPGFSTKHKFRKGTMYPGMDTQETGVADQMSDYARMKAAGGA